MIPVTCAVSPDEQREYERVATALVDHTIRGFTALVKEPQRRVDLRQWKAFKKHETVQIYRARDVKVDGPVKMEWEPAAKLLCIGTIVGTLDDAMYGVIAPTELAMTMRSRYIKDEFSQHRILHDMRVPTRENPFEYFGVRWSARDSSVATLVKPRETLYIESTGYREAQFQEGNSERVGYILFHAIERPELMHGNGMVNARISASFVFREASPGTVELYSTMLIADGGSLPKKLEALAGAAVMISVSRVTECAMLKKLAWMVSRRSRRNDAAQDASTSCCAQCSRSLSSFSSLTECMICEMRVCSRCIMSRRLYFGKSKSTLKRKVIPMCKSCISMVKKGMNTVEIARSEFVKRSSSRERLPSTTPSTGAVSNGSNQESAPESSQSVSDTQSIPEDSAMSLKIVTVDTGDEEIEQIAVVTNDKLETLPATWGVHHTPQRDEKMEWWMRINELRIQAEETYQMAREQTITMNRAFSSRGSSNSS